MLTDLKARDGKREREKVRERERKKKQYKTYKMG